MRRLVVEALHRAGRSDLIGYGKDCLIRPLHSGENNRDGAAPRKSASGENKRGKTDRRTNDRRANERSDRRIEEKPQQKKTRKPNSPTHSKKQQASKAAKTTRRH